MSTLGGRRAMLPAKPTDRSPAIPWVISRLRGQARACGERSERPLWGAGVPATAGRRKTWARLLPRFFGGRLRALAGRQNTATEVARSVAASYL
jgi:hypothetical protein